MNLSRADCRRSRAGVRLWIAALAHRAVCVAHALDRVGLAGAVHTRFALSAVGVDLTRNRLIVRHAGGRHRVAYLAHRAVRIALALRLIVADAGRRLRIAALAHLAVCVAHASLLLPLADAVHARLTLRAVRIDLALLLVDREAEAHQALLAHRAIGVGVALILI